MKPKIIVFTTAYHPFVGGAEIAIQEIARRLRNRFDFYIVTARFLRNLPKREECPEGTVIRIGPGTRFDKWLLPFFIFWNLEFGIWNFRRQYNGLLWGVDIGMGSLTAAILKFFQPKIPFIFNIQYGYGEERLRKGRLGAIGLAFRFILSQADYVTAISTYLLDLARNYGYKGRGEVIHNGVDIQKFKIQNSKLKIKSKNSKVIITTSRLVPKNGIDILIRATAEVKKIIPDIRCYIIGEGEERNNLELEIRNLKLEDTVKLLGQASHDELPKYLSAADIFVRPSRSEGMGNSFVEALEAGLPIIGTPVGGITDIIEDGKTGLFVRLEDSADLAEKIIQLLEDKDLARRLAENGRKMVEERFSWDKIAQNYGNTFDYSLSLLKGYHKKKPSLNSDIRILIATPLFPPQLGGPALYAKHLQEEFKILGHNAQVLPFGNFLRYPSVLRHFLYGVSLAKRAFCSDLIFALDYTSVGLPAAVVSMLLRKPLVIRVEGDFLWESFVERTREEITLNGFYLNPPKLSQKEKLIKKLSGWVMRRASRLVFSSEWRRKMVVEAYGIPYENTAIIRNVFPSLKADKIENLKLKIENSRIILYAGRMLYLKNLYRLINAFRKASVRNWELHLMGDGPELQKIEEYVKKEGIKGVIFMPPASHDELLKKFKSSAFFVLPSFSEVGPNVIADAIATLTPFIMTRETGYTEYMGEAAILADPFDEDDLAGKLKFLMIDKNRKQQKEKIKRLKLTRTWQEAAREWINFFTAIV